jgi:hypothetical protein
MHHFVLHRVRDDPDGDRSGLHMIGAMETLY